MPGRSRAGGFDAVEYRLDEWKGRLCSTCELFNGPDTAFVPFELCLPIDLLQLADFELALSFFSDIGEDAAQAFRSMAVFDSVIANTDRHVGNFGVLRDNATGEMTGIAPIFDNNVSLFARDLDDSLRLGDMLARLEQAPGMLDAALGRQGAFSLGQKQREQVERLVDFEFDGSGFIGEYRAAHPDANDAISEKRLNALGAFVRERARQLLA